MLRNGITVPDERGETVVQILCNTEKVELFLNIVSDVCPEFIDKIRQRPGRVAKKLRYLLDLSSLYASKLVSLCIKATLL